MYEKLNFNLIKHKTIESHIHTFVVMISYKAVIEHLIKRQYSDVDFLKWSERNNFNADMIINATSIGMSPNDNLMPISENQIINTKILMDVVASPSNTKLIKFAKKYKKFTINGPELSFYQACEQFKLYTCKKPPIIAMKKAATKLILKK